MPRWMVAPAGLRDAASGCRFRLPAKPLQQSAGHPFLRSLGVTTSSRPTAWFRSLTRSVWPAPIRRACCGCPWLPRPARWFRSQQNGAQDRGTEMAEAGADLISCQLFQLVECVGIAQGGDGGASVELQISLSAESFGRRAVDSAFPGHHQHPQPFLGGSGLPVAAAVRHRKGGGHNEPAHGAEGHRS